MKYLLENSYAIVYRGILGGMNNLIILITGAKGFVGKNLTAELKNRQTGVLYEYDADADPVLLDNYTKNCNFVFHFAGNLGFTSTLLNSLKKNKNTCPVIFSSSIQATLDNPFGGNKKADEDSLRIYSEETGAKVLIYRFPTIFGQRFHQNNDSVVATLCYNISRGLAIQIRDPAAVLDLVYIDDVVEELLRALYGKDHHRGDYGEIPVAYSAYLWDIAKLIYRFNDSFRSLSVPKIENDFEKKLYSTYLSYLPTNTFQYKMNSHAHHCFSKVVPSANNEKPSAFITKDCHSKYDKYIAVSGKELIQSRKLKLMK